MTAPCRSSLPRNCEPTGEAYEPIAVRSAIIKALAIPMNQVRCGDHSSLSRLRCFAIEVNATETKLAPHAQRH